ncbi:MAG: DNA polymerase III subunit gamma/tau [Longimicrobiales bacterium]|nr:DNA polymerase III subunit gamma/tau [Longimicrobiales bacterium]
MSHIAFARKYRPRSFCDVTAQEHVSETLRRAVTDDRVGHAYLFCGPRGVGKTTLARVLAMALNCGNLAKDGEPCGTCDSCSRIWSGKTALDVVEIDAASNRGVDDARQLRERAMYAPSQEKNYKVYIVDEAHMLTREAWNALLKILEEPPPRVVFVFATTEPQKIQQSVAPILSRCQRFDFHRIGVEEIVKRLEFVVTEEGFSYSAGALKVIARKAEGGMRDALSVLDQVVALTSGEITDHSVTRILGLVQHERYLDVLDIIISRNHGQIFNFVQDLSDEGYDFVEFYHGLVETLRYLLQLSLGSEPSHVDEEKTSSLRERASHLRPSDLLRMLALATDLENAGSLKRHANLQLIVEMLLLRMSYMERTIKIEELLGQLGTPSSEVRTSRKSGEETEFRDDDVKVEDEQDLEADTPARETVTDVASPELGDDAVFSQVWSEVIVGAIGIPRGGKPFLRACRVYGGMNGEFIIQGPSEEIIDKIKGDQFGQAIRDRVRELVKKDIEIVYVSEKIEDTDIDEKLPRERLDALIEKDPGLQRAVDELNLELLN